MSELAGQIGRYLDQLRRENASTHTIRNYAADLAQFLVHQIFGGQAHCFMLGLAQQVQRFIGCHKVTCQPGERGNLVPARASAAGRHHHAGVPYNQVQAAKDIADFADADTQGLQAHG